MSRTRNRPRPKWQKETFSRRSSLVKIQGWVLERFAKKRTHKIEQRIAVRELQEETCSTRSG